MGKPSQYKGNRKKGKWYVEEEGHHRQRVTASSIFREVAQTKQSDRRGGRKGVKSKEVASERPGHGEGIGKTRRPNT